MLTLMALLLSVTAAASPAPALQPGGLRCEYAVEPVAVDTTAPRLSWVNEPADDNARGLAQTAYQIGASSSRHKLLEGDYDLWNPGRTEGRDAIQITYAGEPLASNQGVWWRVRVWDQDGAVSAWSEPARFTMGLLAHEDWQGVWIRDPRPLPQDDDAMFLPRPAPLFRKAFVVETEVERARLHIAGLGYCEARLNGQRASENVHEPGWTNYARRVPYATYDVTERLEQGRNCLGVMLGDGWWNPLPLMMWGRLNLRDYVPTGAPQVIAQLEIDYAGGGRHIVATGPDWRVGDGPIVKNNVYLGETYDARLEQPGWDRPGFADGDWRRAAIAEAPGGPLRSQVGPPVRVQRILKPVAITEPEPGVFIYDFGENIAGVARLHVEAPPGTKVALRYGEILHPDGRLNGLTSACGQIKRRERPDDSPRPVTAWQRDVYACKGAGRETYAPRFTFHGFRYVEVTGYPGTPTLDDLEAVVMHAEVPSAGRFECSEPLLNQIQEITRRAFYGNLFSVQSDCPHREKFGYGGDIVASSEAALLNFDMARFYWKTLNDFAETVRPNGGFAETAPYVGIDSRGLGQGSGPVGWATTHPLLLAQLYQYYGDARLIQREYPRIQAWIELLLSKSEDGVLINGIGDHESLVEKPLLSGTAFLAMNLRLAAQFARLLGHADDAARYEAEWRRVRAAFNARFYDEAKGRYDDGQQAAQAFALYMDLAGDHAEAALDALVRDILEERGGHLTTGIFGTKYMLDQLSARGRHAMAWTVATQPDYPGWGHMLANGATTLWETWAYSDDTYSHNHPMFGSVSEWMIKRVAGLRPAPDACGFDKVIIEPGLMPGKDMGAGAEYDSVRGTIAVRWRTEGGRLTVDVRVPVGVEAKVMLPVEAAAVTESGATLKTAEGVTTVERPDGGTAITAGSGTYQFRVTRLTIRE